MALSVPAGFQGRYMKEGARFFGGLDEAVLRNIEACLEFGNQLKTAFGPCGMNKLVVNDIAKEFITTDSATIVRELDIQHPAARLLVMAAEAMESGPGDGVHTTVLLACALLEGAVDLINMGLRPVEIVEGYNTVFKALVDKFDGFVIEKATDLRNPATVYNYLRTAVMSKQLKHADLVSKLVAKACVQISSDNTPFNVDNIRIVKIPGGSVRDSMVLNGMVFHRSAETDRRHCKNARVALFACPFDITQTETKGTVHLTNATELLEFSNNEEKEVEKQVRSLHEAGVNVIVAAGKFGDLYVHYLNKFDMMGVRLVSKFDLRRLCRMLGAPAQASICTPSLDHLGQCDEVNQIELSGQQVIIFEKAGQAGKICSLVIRGPTTSQLNDIERAADDGINTFKILSRDNQLVAGAGAFELQVARFMEYLANKDSSVHQFITRKFGHAFESLVKQLARNAGLNPTVTLAHIYAQQKKLNTSVGVDIYDGNGFVNAKEAHLFDSFAVKSKAVETAVDVASQILLVDQIIMARPAGGPKVGPGGPRMADPEGNDDGMA